MKIEIRIGDFMVVIGGPASQLLAGRVAASLNESLALCDYRTFPDGESYSQIQSELDDNIIIIQSTPTDKDLVYLLQLLDICQGRPIKLVIPYFGYARQDKIFQPGEPMTARAVASALNPFLKEGSVFLINIHAPSIMIHFHCPAESLDATPLLAERIAGMGLQDPVVISPDKGAMNMARTAARALGSDCDFLQKTRLSGTEVSMAPQEVAVAGRDVVIFDDMIATGGTMATAITMLRRQGAKRVYLAAVHPVLTGSAVLRLYRSGVEAVLATDTLDKAVSTVSVAPLIARAIKS